MVFMVKQRINSGDPYIGVAKVSWRIFLNSYLLKYVMLYCSTITHNNNYIGNFHYKHLSANLIVSFFIMQTRTILRALRLRQINNGVFLKINKASI